MKRISFLTCSLAWMCGVACTLEAGSTQMGQPSDPLYPVPEVPALVPTTGLENIFYGDGAPTVDQRLDIYLPKDARIGEAMPIAVFIHGGAWNTGRGSQSIQLRERLLKERFLVVRISYTLSPNPPQLQNPGRAMHPVHVTDLAKALAWLKRNAVHYGANPSDIHLIGVSAGAHLANLLSLHPHVLRTQGVESHAVRAVVSIDAGPYLQLQPKEIAQWAYFLQWQNAFGKDTAIWQDASPGRHITAARYFPAFMLLYSGDWRFRGQPNLRYADSLRAKGALVKVFPCEAYDHQTIFSSIGTPADTIGILEHIIQFVKEQRLP